jgi:c-di-AMP phosphodiesterase-like protein
MANALAELIADASRVFVMGHKHADLDSVGGSVAVCCIARNKGRQCRIVIDRQQNASEALISRLEQEPEYAGAFISPQEAMLMADSRSLLVVVDTNRPEQVEDNSLLQTCNRVAVIDHHRRAATYIQKADLTFHEPFASSVCELMSEGRIRPELVIGVPVGFVNVAGAKELILGNGVPHIVAKGRKGGSGVAAAVCNALLLLARGEKEKSS